MRVKSLLHFTSLSSHTEHFKGNHMFLCNNILCAVLYFMYVCIVIMSDDEKSIIKFVA